MSSFFLKIFNFFYWLPVSVGNHTHYSGGGSTHTTTTHSYSGTHTTGGSSSGSSNPVALIIGVIVVAAIIIIAFRAKKKVGSFIPNAQRTSNLAKPQNNNDAVIASIKQNDPNFSSERFLSWSEQVFCQLQQAWTERDWKKARPFESEELFNLHKSQLDEYIRNGTINVMENVCVNESWFLDYKQEENHEFVTVFMQTSYYDYIIKEDTKEVVRGDRNREYRVNYKLKFMRSLGVKTGEFSNKSTHNCPNCGAPVDVNAAGQCAYCGTVITDGEHDWVLCNLDDCGQE